MQTGIYAHIDLSAFVTAAKFDLFGAADCSDNDILFTKWANDAVKYIDCLINKSIDFC